MMSERASGRFRTVGRKRRRCGVAGLAAVLACVAVSHAVAQSQTPASPPPCAADTIAEFIAEASQRFGIPQGWIAAVMRAESAFDARATSPKGAMGLMQLMPDTWASLRARLGLGADPYNPRDNVLAGARYLRDLYDQFGARGFLAAYNAGPGRYGDSLTGGRPLPEETRAYVAKVAAAIDARTAVTPPVRSFAAARPPGPGIFVALTRSQAGPATATPSSGAAPRGAPFELSRVGASALFVDALGATAR
jgi:hypothetical protein